MELGKYDIEACSIYVFLPLSLLYKSRSFNNHRIKIQENE